MDSQPLIRRRVLGFVAPGEPSHDVQLTDRLTVYWLLVNRVYQEPRRTS